MGEQMEITSTALFGTWIDADSEKPPRKEYYGGFWHSMPVIVTNGKDIFMGYFQSWDDPEYNSGWKLKGPDGWAINGVTHWMYPPPLPNADLTGKQKPEKEVSNV